MLILTIRTDKPEAEIGFYDGNEKLAYEKWQAHRQLAETIHLKIAKNLQSIGKEWSDMQGIVVYKGPGSFTGLRIGLSVANALAFSLAVPIISVTGEDWVETGIKRLHAGQNEKTALPEYGAPVHTTPPK
jgi:tRNA threonylcarbamoyladenosine biosynthesis protein TsaB